MAEESNINFDPDTVAGPLDPQVVIENEKMIGLKFDSDYLTHLLKFNGGVPRQRNFKLGNNVKVVERFLCMIPDYQENNEHGSYDVGVVWSQIEDRLDDYLVPFAALYAGDFLCFDYKKGEKPEVVIWDHERSNQGNPVTEFVANSFTDFLKLLYQP